MARALPLALASALLLAGCAAPVATTPTTPSASTPSAPIPSTATPPDDPRATGTPLALAEGASWTFAWTREERSFVQGAGSSSGADAGTFTLTLGAPRALDGARAFPLAAEGETRAGGRDLAPRWRWLATEGARLLGSEDGDTLEVVYDGARGAWTDGGFFATFDGPVEGRAGSFANEYLDTTALVVSRSTQEGGCVYEPGIGNICGDDSETSVVEREAYKAGVGPLGYELRVTRTDEGGGFTTAFSTLLQVGLVATTLHATDGWTPRMPPWTRAAPLPTPREGLLVVAVDGQLHAIGGATRVGDDWVGSRVVETYDPTADAWSAGAPSPVALADPAGAAMHGRIYVVDARGEPETPLYVYDTRTRTWTDGPPLPRAITRAHAAAFDDALYVVGSPPYERGGPRNVAYLYDSNEGTWYETDAPPTYRNGFAFASDGRYALLAAHYYDERYDGAMHRFDFEPGTWEVGASMDEPRFGGAGASAEGEVFVLGGQVGSAKLRSVEAYDVAADAWRPVAPMSVARTGHAAAALDGVVYVVGGIDADGRAVARVDRLDARAS